VWERETRSGRDPFYALPSREYYAQGRICRNEGGNGKGGVTMGDVLDAVGKMFADDAALKAIKVSNR